MSSLVERQLLLSPSLAATIGLEAALLYQLLSDWQTLLASRNSSDQHWCLVDTAKLADQLPFWNIDKILQVLGTLHDQGLIIIGSALMSNAQNIRFALPQTGQKPAPPVTQPAETPAASPSPYSGPNHLPDNNSQASQRNTAPPAATEVNNAWPRQPVPGHTTIHSHWRPDQATLDYLIRFNQVDPGFIDAQLPEFIAHYKETGQTRASWTSTFSQFVSRRWKKAQYQQIEQARNHPIDERWQPSLDALEILDREGISRSFIEDAIPEFLLYWRERGTIDNNWNARFLQHIRLQWARYNRSVPSEQELAPIPANWQPNDAVFDILHMARIDADFAREQVPEFILFWRDSGQAHRSWNTKFLQHVKYRWAQRHHLGHEHARQQHTSGSSPAKTGFIEKHTDRSWRDGL